MSEKNLIEVIEEGYQRRIKHFEMEKHTYDYVVAGDSMVAYFNTHAFFPKLSMMNQGIPGDTTKGLLKRLAYIYKVKPKVVMINIGSNDLVILSKSPKEIVESIVEIIHLIEIKLNQTKVYLFNITPVNPDLDISNKAFISNRKNSDIRTINELLIQVISKEKIINIYDLVVDQNQKLDEQYTSDGIHLNDKGYQIYKNLIKDKL